jgi:hypothetical protein
MCYSIKGQEQQYMDERYIYINNSASSIMHTQTNKTYLHYWAFLLRLQCPQDERFANHSLKGIVAGQRLLPTLLLSFSIDSLHGDIYVRWILFWRLECVTFPETGDMRLLWINNSWQRLLPTVLLSFSIDSLSRWVRWICIIELFYWFLRWWYM